MASNFIISTYLLFRLHSYKKIIGQVVLVQNIFFIVANLIQFLFYGIFTKGEFPVEHSVQKYSKLHTHASVLYKFYLFSRKVSGDR